MSIGLALSGGGFRATLFHLGVIDTLRRRGALPKVTEISSVSGGSILAAYLVWRWDEFLGSDASYHAACKKIIALARCDLRNRILGYLVLRHALWLPWLFPSWRSASMLETKYRQFLFGNATLADLASGNPITAPRPFLSILSTSLTTGQIVAFETDGVRFGPVHQNQAPYAQATDISLARAVAASAGFPLLSSPILLPRDVLGFNVTDGPDHELTDGGVFDNLGVCWLGFASSKRQNGPLDKMLLSDAGIPFDWAPRDSYHSRWGYGNRNMRANDIQMTRLAEYDWGKMKRFARDFREFRIGTRYAPVPGLLSSQLQLRASRIRTDLNRFTAEEINLLVRHGQQVALNELSARPI